MASFTPIQSLLGGILIGIATSLLLVFNGRIAGISGIVSALLTPRVGDIGWRVWFTAGLLSGGLLLVAFSPEVFVSTTQRPIWLALPAGLLVGFGTSLGSGCTSGHGVCGLSRLSVRSLASTLTFIAVGVLSVTVFRLFG